MKRLVTLKFIAVKRDPNAILNFNLIQKLQHPSQHESTLITYCFCGALNDFLLFRQEVSIGFQVSLLCHSHFLFSQISSYCKSQCKQRSMLYLWALSITTKEHMSVSLSHVQECIEITVSLQQNIRPKNKVIIPTDANESGLTQEKLNF